MVGVSLYWRSARRATEGFSRGGRPQAAGLAGLEGECQIAARHVLRPAQPEVIARTILGVELAILGFVVEVGRQARTLLGRFLGTEHDRFEVVGQQDTARALAGGVVHDSALE